MFFQPFLICRPLKKFPAVEQTPWGISHMWSAVWHIGIYFFSVTFCRLFRSFPWACQALQTINWKPVIYVSSWTITPPHVQCCKRSECHQMNNIKANVLGILWLSVLYCLSNINAGCLSNQCSHIKRHMVMVYQHPGCAVVSTALDTELWVFLWPHK